MKKGTEMYLDPQLPKYRAFKKVAHQFLVWWIEWELFFKGPNDIKFTLNDQGSRSGINQNLKISLFHFRETGFQQFFGKHGIQIGL